jgi:hypothetical protein
MNAITLAFAVLALLSLGLTSPVLPQTTPPRSAIDYMPSTTCEGCHDEIVRQHLESQHEKSFDNPTFQAQYFSEVVPRASRDPMVAEEARLCIACHAPIAFKRHGGRVSRREQVDSQMSGVTCDFCHTIEGFVGSVPGNGNFISFPSCRKLGPFRHENEWHHVYSELQTKSEFCGICHNAVNHRGLEIKSTYTEWKNSRYAREGIECQDCHMTVYGFLTGGKPTYESGAAARMALARPPARSKLYTHRFPGAHSRTQVVGAITLMIEPDRTLASPREIVTVRVLVDNTRTGHKMPSGSADLRQLWLNLELSTGTRAQAIPATSASVESFETRDVVGSGPYDKEILRTDIPKGSRIYRALFVDSAGKPTLSSYDAVKVEFDNRLNAAEVRTETYGFSIPADAKDAIQLKATLNYLPYPSSFTSRFGLPKPDPVEVASAQKTVQVRHAP